MKLEDWTYAGYKRWDFSDKTLNKLADFGLQKRFDDERGKKYFITVYVYDRSKYPGYPWGKVDESQYGFMPTVNFNLRDEKMFFDITLNGTFTVESCEKWFELMWELVGQPYYEEWE